MVISNYRIGTSYLGNNIRNRSGNNEGKEEREYINNSIININDTSHNRSKLCGL